MLHFLPESENSTSHLFREREGQKTAIVELKSFKKDTYIQTYKFAKVLLNVYSSKRNL